MLNACFSLLMPLLLLLIVAVALKHKVPVFDSFQKGALAGAKLAFKILPTLLFLLSAVAALKASGAVDRLTHLAAPLLEAVGIPKELAPLAFLRPFSGSGTVAVFQTILAEHGPDSFVTRAASVILASTETTFYTAALYFGAVGVRKTGRTLPAAVAADITGFVVGCALTRLLFH